MWCSRVERGLISDVLCQQKYTYYRHIFFTRGLYQPYCDSKSSYIHTRSVLVVQCVEVQTSDKLPATGEVKSECLIWRDSLIGNGKTPPPCPEAIARCCRAILWGRTWFSPQTWFTSGRLGGDWDQSICSIRRFTLVLVGKDVNVLIEKYRGVKANT